ncbi:hypothetical protein B484DRAFT_113232 [Ochromonadaceae sp. CCMP2298]|nr:hypothetical protein B484DRAFT_113232 [Ochromonadaceae sp. CCMP2298]
MGDMDGDILTVVFTVLECPDNRSSARRDNAYLNSCERVMSTQQFMLGALALRGEEEGEEWGERKGEREVEKGDLMGTGTGQGQGQGGVVKRQEYGNGNQGDQGGTLYHSAAVRTVVDVLSALYIWAEGSHVTLRMLGVRKVTIRYPNPDFVGSVGAGGVGGVGGGAGMGGVEEYITYTATIHPLISSLCDDPLPSLAPHARPATHSPTEDPTDDFVVSLRNVKNPVMVAQEMIKTQVGDGVNRGWEEEKEREMVGLTRARADRVTNERLISAIRLLHKEGEMTSHQAKFWEGSLGHLRHKTTCQMGLKLALHPESGVFNGVHVRLALYEGMYHRDDARLCDIITQLELGGKSAAQKQGGMALIYALRLRSEIAGLRRCFQDTAALATSYPHLSMVEDFLLLCGRLGYSGPEMFEAVELRQKIVAEALANRVKGAKEALPGIKLRALVSNLLISRELGNLGTKLSQLGGELGGEECVVAQQMLLDCDNCVKQVVAASGASVGGVGGGVGGVDVEALDAALAYASYHYFYTPPITPAISLLRTLTNPCTLLAPIVHALRKGDDTLIGTSFEAVAAMGWVCGAVDASLCVKIIHRHGTIMEDEAVKERLIQRCLAVKNGFKVNANETMQLLRRAYKLRLDEDPLMAPYLKTMSKKVKKFAGVLRQEKVIQTAIDQNNVPLLSRLLQGRGEGRLVMCAPSAYALDEWLQYLGAGCSGHFKRSICNEAGEFVDQAFFSGTMEKAARNEQGRVSGWRQRYFVLGAVSLSYHTKARGSRKGTIRVLGGGVRRMPADECQGKQHCLELEEGRDISQVDPDLLAEASKYVLQTRGREFAEGVKRAVGGRDLGMLVRMLRYASESSIPLDPLLLSQVRERRCPC